MHTSARNFVETMKEKLPSYFAGKSVLEVGSRNVNGTVRDLFEDCEYVGVDQLDGPGVDFVGWADEYVARNPGKKFDVVFSTEALEHDPRARETVLLMVSLLTEDGFMFVTCAGKGRKVHSLEDTDHYENILEDDIHLWLKSTVGIVYQVYENSKDKDIYFWVKRIPTREAR